MQGVRLLLQTHRLIGEALLALEDITEETGVVVAIQTLVPAVLVISTDVDEVAVVTCVLWLSEVLPLEVLELEPFCCFSKSAEMKRVSYSIVMSNKNVPYRKCELNAESTAGWVTKNCFPSAVPSVTV